MDNVTHALAGLLMAEATAGALAARTRRPPPAGFRRTAAIVGVVAAELPDIDVVYSGPVLGMGSLGYMLHHRGHTHTVLLAVLGALLVWGVVALLRRGPERRVERRALGALTLAGTLSHVLLDWTNSYGVHPFWPVDNRWYYGDAIFIIEPWLWVVAIPPLLLAATGRIAQGLLALALGGILLAAWTLGPVEREVALVLTIAAAAWLAVVRAAPPARRIALGVVAWLVVEGVFFAASGAARAQVRAAVGGTLADAVLTPAVGNPFCFGAFVVEADETTYRVTTAAVAAVPAVHGVGACPDAFRGGGRWLAPAARAGTPALRWGGEWSAPRAELVELARGNCVFHAGLRFIRVPAWERRADGTFYLTDLRYAGAGFADVAGPLQPARCPPHVPPWTPPRGDLLGLR